MHFVCTRAGLSFVCLLVCLDGAFFLLLVLARSCSFLLVLACACCWCSGVLLGCLLFALVFLRSLGAGHGTPRLPYKGLDGWRR